MTNAFAAILGGLKDVIFGRLTWLALLNLVVALTITIAAATGIIRWVVPLIPDGAGWLGYLSTAGEFAATIAVVVLAIALSPAVSMMVGGVLFDIAAERVEKKLGIADARGVPVHVGLLNGLRIGIPALIVNLIVLPLYLIPVVNALVFYGLNGFLMGREYLTQAGVRRMAFTDAVAFRRRKGLSVFLIGLACSFIPFFAPLVGASAMTRFVASSR